MNDEMTSRRFGLVPSQKTVQQINGSDEQEINHQDFNAITRHRVLF
jgi:hypothetical protein